jgi:hypothetical protein
VEDEWEIDDGTFSEPCASDARTLLARWPVEFLLRATYDVYDNVFGSDQIGHNDVAHVATYIAAGKVDDAHFELFSERARRALVGSYRLQELYVVYQAFIETHPAQRKLLDRLVNHAFHSGMMFATGCERIGDLVSIAHRDDLRRQKQSDAAWETGRKRSAWKRDARELYETVRRERPVLTTATKILARMNELRRIPGSSDEQLLKLIRIWRSEERKIAQSVPKVV